MIFPSFFVLTTVISKDDVVTSIIFTCTFFLTWTMLDNLEKWYLFPCWSPKIQLGGQIHPNSWSCRNSSNPFMQLEGFIVQLPMGSNGFQILEVDGWSGGNLRGRRTAWLSAARRVHMLIKFSKLNMTFFGLEYVTKVLRVSGYDHLRCSSYWECCTSALLPQCERVRYYC